MRNVRLGMKLMLAFGLVLALFAVSGVFSYFQLRESSEQVDFIVDDELTALLDDAETRNAGADLLLSARTYRLTETPEALETLKQSMDGIKHDLGTTKEMLVKYPRLEVTKEFLPIIEQKINALVSETEKAAAMVAKKEEVYNALVEARKNAFDLVDDFRKGLFTDVADGARQNDIEAVNRRLEQMKIITEIELDMTEVRVLTVRLIENKANTTYGPEALKLLPMIMELVKKMDSVVVRPEAKQRVAKIGEALSVWQGCVTEYVNQHAATLDAFLKNVGPAQSEFVKTLDDYDTKLVAGMKELSIVANTKLVTTQYVLIISIIAAIIVGFLVAFLITRAITKPLNRVVELAKRAEGGDLTVKKAEFQYEGHDEIGNLVNAISAMIGGQAEITKQVVSVARKVTEESQTLAATSQETNASMEEIRASVMEVNRLSESNGAALEESNAGVEEMAAGATTVAQSATDGAEDVAKTGDVSEKAVSMVEEVISEMNLVGKKSDENEAQIRKLADSVEQISGFVSVITSIADQTNLLALNAAIEAARAGEAGRGFAVVADEVRKLAEESGNSAKNVSQLISSLQSNARIAITSTVDSAEIVQKTMKKAGDAQKALHDAISRIKHVNENIQNIAAVAEEQAASSKEMASAIDTVTTGMSEVGERIRTVQQSTDGASIAAENVATAAQTLNSLAEDLTKLLAHFKVDDTQKQLSLK